MLSAIHHLVNKGYLSKIARAWNQRFYLFVVQETLAVWVALSTCRAVGWLNFGSLSHIKRTQDWSVLPYHKAGIVGKSVLQSPAIPPTPLCFFESKKQHFVHCPCKTCWELSKEKVSQATFSCSLFLLAPGQPSLAGVVYQQIRRKRKERKREKMSNRKRFDDLSHGHGPPTTWFSVSPQIFSTSGAKATLTFTPPCAGCCCKAGTAIHIKEGISIWRAAASSWLCRRDENTAFVLIKVGF